jgi:3-oxoacyl-[acyl-carrier protein] reductase
MSRRGGAVVIGGASGLGAAIAVALAGEGWAVTIGDRDIDSGAAPVDVTDEDSVAALLESVEDLDLVVNCAGVSTLGLVTELDAEEFRRVVDTCLTGAFLVIKHAGQRVRPGGSIVSLSSLNARQPGTGMSAYCAAKAGLVMLTEVAALELAPKGIRVNTVSPGLVETPLTAPALEIPGIEDDYLDNTPLGRKGEPEEIAAAVVYLASAAWVTGETLDINGGAHLRRYPDLYSHVMKAFA